MPLEGSGVMTGRSSIRDSRLASFAQQYASGDDSSGGSRPLTLGGFAATVLSVIGSVIAYGVLPDQIRIHWTLGLGPYYGPEFAPTWVLLAVFPVFIASVGLGAHWIGARLRANESANVNRLYSIAVLGTLVLLLGIQAFLIVANL